MGILLLGSMKSYQCNKPLRQANFVALLAPPNFLL